MFKNVKKLALISFSFALALVSLMSMTHLNATVEQGSCKTKKVGKDEKCDPSGAKCTINGYAGTCGNVTITGPKGGTMVQCGCNS